MLEEGPESVHERTRLTDLVDEGGVLRLKGDGLEAQHIQPLGRLRRIGVRRVVAKPKVPNPDHRGEHFGWEIPRVRILGARRQKQPLDLAVVERPLDGQGARVDFPDPLMTGR